MESRTDSNWFIGIGACTPLPLFDKHRLRVRVDEDEDDEVDLPGLEPRAHVLFQLRVGVFWAPDFYDDSWQCSMFR